MHPPFPPGNTAALKHGAQSPQVVRPLADAIAAELATIAPWTSAPAYATTVGALAWTEAQVLLLREWLDEQGLLDGDGIPRPASNRLDRLEARAENLRARCGLDPLSMVKLLGGLTAIAATTGGDDLERLKAEGRRIVSTWQDAQAELDAATTDHEHEDDQAHEHDDDEPDQEATP